MINLLPFQEKFPDEQSCKNHFKKLREINKVKCKKCSSTEHYWLKSKEQWECKKCQFRTTLKSGTILQSSNLTFYTWYKAIFIITQSDKILNSSEVKKILGFKRYEPVWYMMQKIRTLMLVNHNKIMENCDDETCEGILKINNRRIHFGELRKILESFEVEKQSYTYALKVRLGKYERIKIVPYYDFIPLNIKKPIFYSIKHLRGTLDGRKSFFRKIFTINCHQKLSRILDVSKEKNQIAFKKYTKEIYSNWRTVSYKYLQLYLDEIGFSLNYGNKRQKLKVVVDQGIRFNWYNSG